MGETSVQNDDNDINSNNDEDEYQYCSSCVY